MYNFNMLIEYHEQRIIQRETILSWPFDVIHIDQLLYSYIYNWLKKKLTDTFQVAFIRLDI